MESFLSIDWEARSNNGGRNQSSTAEGVSVVDVREIQGSKHTAEAVLGRIKMEVGERQVAASEVSKQELLVMLK